jgi:hypothetical protein
MNVPDTAASRRSEEVLAWPHYPRRTKSGAFFRKRSAPTKKSRLRDAWLASRSRPDRDPCPFSIQGEEKLMQKTHRLTDN